MAAVSNQRKPTFFWQGVLILLPVAVLAIVSLISLRQDERAAEQDAHNRATENVQSLAHAMRSSVNEEIQRFLVLQNTWEMELYLASQPSVSSEFPDAKLSVEVEKWEHDYPKLKLLDSAVPQSEILMDGRLIDPPDFPAVPVPPKWFRELTPEQKVLWENLRAANTRTEINECQQAFLDSKPPEQAQLAVRYHLHRPPEPQIGDSDAIPTEAGISFEEIACYQLLSATNAQLTNELLQSVWWQVIRHPSFLSPKLLELAGGLTNRATSDIQQKFFWTQHLWNGRSQAEIWLQPLRRLAELTNGWNPPMFWSHWTGGSANDALTFFTPSTFVNPGNDSEGISLSGRGYNVWFVPRAVLENIFTKTLAENKFFIPGYVTTTISVAGNSLTVSGVTNSTSEKSLLSSTTQKFGPQMMTDAASFELKFYLASREQMLASEHQRAKLFGVLILGAALAALIGFIAALRAFRRQQQLGEMKSNFVSSVSHELRAPIASVRLMAENLELGKISEPVKQQEYFRFIVQECRRLSALIESVLDFSRIEQSRKQYEFELTNVSALVSATMKLMEPYAAEKEVRLALEIPGLESKMTNIEWQMDGRAMQQALVNLIDNAIKHSPKGEVVTVRVEIKNNKRATNPAATFNDQLATLNLSVADHGPGIPPAEHAKIFERFYRRGSELRRETQGVGIGLSIVKHIVDAHGGTISVQSDIGKGSRFTIEIPLNHQDTKAQRKGI